MAEGVFPKVGGDPLYFSEVNRFYKAPVFIAAGSFVTASGTAQQEEGTLGSIFINGSVTGSSCVIRGYISSNKLDQDIFVITFSGGDTIYNGPGFGSGPGMANGRGYMTAFVGHQPGFVAGVLYQQNSHLQTQVNPIFYGMQGTAPGPISGGLVILNRGTFGKVATVSYFWEVISANA